MGPHEKSILTPGACAISPGKKARGRAAAAFRYNTSIQRGEAAKAAWINPTCEYVCGKLPHMRWASVS